MVSGLPVHDEHLLHLDVPLPPLGAELAPAPRPHNFVEYPKAGREGIISTLPAQAATESIMFTLTAPGCHRVHFVHPGIPRLSHSQFCPLSQPQAVKKGKGSPLEAPSYQTVNKMHS